MDDLSTPCPAKHSKASLASLGTASLLTSLGTAHRDVFPNRVSAEGPPSAYASGRKKMGLGVTKMGARGDRKKRGLGVTKKGARGDKKIRLGATFLTVS